MSKNLCFTTKRGNKLCGVLELPNEIEAPFPVLIFCHGFLSEKNKLFASGLTRGLTSRGFAVYKYDLPGHGNSEGSKDEVTLPRNIVDLKSIIDMLSILPEIDTSRIGVAGHSFGGITALLSPAYDSRIKTVVSLGAALNFKGIIEHMVKAGKMVRKDGCIFYNFVPFFIKQRCHRTLYAYSQKFDLVAEAAKIEVPALIIHGVKDNTIPLEFARETAQALPGKVKLVTLGNEGHLFIRPGTTKKLVKIISNWLTENL